MLKTCAEQLCSIGSGAVFKAWLERDEAAAADLVSTIAPENSVFTLSNKYIDIPTLDTKPKTQGVDTNQGDPTLDTLALERVDTEPDILMLVACRRFGQMFKFRVEDFINETQALITSVLTREFFTVPVEELSLWEGIA